MNSLTRVLSPKEEELKRKRKELEEMEQELTEEELCLSTARGELNMFERRYNQIVGVKYAEYDEVRAQIFDLAAKLYPKADGFRESAEHAREQARQSSEETADVETESPCETNFKPSEELKKLFRDVAKKIHPDLTSDPKERTRRHDLMAKLNQAYDQLDEESIRSVLIEWESGHESAKEVSPGTHLVRIIRQVAQVRKRMQRITRDLEKLKNSEMFKLKQEIKAAERSGRNLLHVMAADMDEKIIAIRSKVRDLAAGLE